MASQVAALDIGYKPRLDLPKSLKFLYLLGAVSSLFPTINVLGSFLSSFFPIYCYV